MNSKHLLLVLLSFLIYIPFSDAQCLVGDCKDGYGKLVYKNGDTYIGQFKDGKSHGQGICVYSNPELKGMKYVGSWKAGKIEGEGRMHLADGSVTLGIWKNNEYVKESKRSKSELTINPDGSPKEETSGLSRDYITQFSYGIVETFNLFIPGFTGGGNTEDVGKDSATYDAFRKLGATTTQAAQEAKRAPLYWGDQPIVEAPAYVGAVVLFLFVFALFLVKGRLKWWLVGGTVLSLLLSYGKNLGFLTDFFIDYVPLYNKFRAVSSIQVVLELCIPALAIFGLVRLFNDFENKEHKLKALKYSAIITSGLALLFLLFKSSFFDFVGVNDGYYRQSYGQDFVDALKSDRKTLFGQDTLRTLVLVVLSAGAIFLFLKEKLKETWVIVAFAVLILFDLVGVDRRYVNNDDFVSGVKMSKPFQASEVDQYILKDKSHYKVHDLVSGPSKPSYYHNSLNGYNAAELRRYREVFDFYLAQNNINVLNMLNTKYIVAPDEEGKPFPYQNETANGNAWFVEKLIPVNNADEEINALKDLDTSKEAVVNTGKIDGITRTNFKRDSTALIELTEYKPNHLKYRTKNQNSGLAVFSEMYYAHGWNAFIDGKPVEHFKVNYVLRALEVPQGRHDIEFKFEPEVVETGSKITLASSILLGLITLGGIGFSFWRTRKKVGEPKS